jgi:hypothetical protein
MMQPRLLLVLGLGAAVVAGCHGGPKQKSVEALDKELTSANSADPVVKSALEDQIMVDPQLASKANAHSIRPPDEADGAPLPPSESKPTKAGDPPESLGQKAYANLPQAQRGCNMAVAYSAAWATRLPAELPIYPQGHVSEAAGSDTPACHLRVVSYSSGATPQALADFYTAQGQQSGYAVSKSGSTLNANRAKDNAMFSITLAPERDGGTAVDVVTNAGR